MSKESAVIKAAKNIPGLKIEKSPLRFTAPDQMDVPAKGATVTVDRGDEAKRLTATRIALAGPFALAFKKNKTQVFITIEGTDGSGLLIECPVKREADARKLALLVRALNA